jgi:hypothetical protein
VEKMRDLFKAVGMEKGDMGTIEKTFRNMGIAEDCISEYKKLYPDVQEELHDTFVSLVSSQVLFVINSEMLYRAHCKELLTRIAKGGKRKDLDNATDAECLAAIMGFSLQHPLSNDYAYAYYQLFIKLFPEIKFEPVMEDGMYESWPGRFDEIITTLKRKLHQKGRGGVK